MNYLSGVARVTVLVMLTGLILTSCVADQAMPLAISANSQQLILVVTPDFNATSGKLYRFERNPGSKWQQVAPEISAVVGRGGVGWGLEQSLRRTRGPQKREGDGRSPAGLYRLGTVFGFKTPEEVADLKMPYLQVTGTVECVDDGNSRYYNQIVDRDSCAVVDWQSSEKMQAIGAQYHLGVTVEHNAKRLEGAGSCIFLHIWGGPDSTTSGCTAVAADELSRITSWLDQRLNPVFVQLPEAAYRQIGKPSALPQI